MKRKKPVYLHHVSTAPRRHTFARLTFLADMALLVLVLVNLTKEALELRRQVGFPYPWGGWKTQEFSFP